MRFGGAEFIGKAFRYSHHRTSSGRHNLRLLRPVKRFCGFTLNARRAHRQLTEAARSAGRVVYQIETADELHASWFDSSNRVGVTAGTSTPDETIHAVMTRLKQFDAEQCASSPVGRLAPVIQRACAAIL